MNFDLPNISENFIYWLSSQKGGLRALALLQVEESNVIQNCTGS